MTTPGLFLLLLLLAGRFALIGEAGFPPRPARVLASALLQAAAVLTAFAGLGRPLAAAALLIGMEGARLHFERRAARRGTALHTRRLGWLVLEMAALAVAASPGFGLAFRDLAPTLKAAAVWCAPLGTLAGLPARRTLLMAIGLLLCLREANLAIRGVLEGLSLKPAEPTAPGGVPSAAEYRRGWLIGLLERSLLYALVLGGQYGALGFVISAKALARFKNLDDQGFAEYFLVGTLLSVVIAGAVALAVRAAGF